MENSNIVSFPPVEISHDKGPDNKFNADEIWGEEKVLMEKFLDDFDLDGIGEEDIGDGNDDFRNRSGGGPYKRGRAIKKRRKQGISPNDPRKYYSDRLVNALCTGDIENVRAVMERYHDPNCVYIQRFTNNTPDLPGYREIHGREQMISFYRAFLASSPDCVVKVTDRQLNVYQDGSSYLVSKINFSGAWLFRIFFSNILRKTRSFLTRTLFNRPTILNPFRSKSSSSTSTNNNADSASNVTQPSSTAAGHDSSGAKAVSYSFFKSFNRKSHRTSHESDAKDDASNGFTTDATSSSSINTDNESIFRASSSHQRRTCFDNSTLKTAAEVADDTDHSEVEYLHGDMHLVVGKASVYDKSIGPPAPLSPLSVSSTDEKLNLTLENLSTSLPENQHGINSASPLQNVSSAQEAKISASSTANIRSDSLDILEAESPWQDLPFSVIKDEQVSNAPIPAPAALIVTPESEVSVIPAKPKPYRVNIAISNVAHINSSGRIYKVEMFMKAEVSISWWSSDKASAEEMEDMGEPFLEEEEEEEEGKEISAGNVG